MSDLPVFVLKPVARFRIAMRGYELKAGKWTQHWFADWSGGVVRTCNSRCGATLMSKADAVIMSEMLQEWGFHDVIVEEVRASQNH